MEAQEHVLSRIHNLQVANLKELQRFWGLVNYIVRFYSNIAQDRLVLNEVLWKSKQTHF